MTASPGAQYCVVGGGIIGLWTALHLQRAGHTTTLIDQFPLPHSRGSSYGGSRVWRLLGDDDPTKVVYSMDEWLNLEAQTGTKLFVKTGLLNFGPESDPYLKSHMSVLKAHHYPTSFLTAGELKMGYPMMRYPAEWGAAWDPSGGILLATQCLTAVENRFRSLGGRVITEKVIQVLSEQTGAIVLSQQPESCHQKRRKFAKVIVCGGPWTKLLLPQLAPFLKTVVIPVTYFREISPSEQQLPQQQLQQPQVQRHEALLKPSAPTRSRLDLAADRIRALKAKRAPIEEVRAAVQAYIAEELFHPETAAPGPFYSVASGFPVLFNARLKDIYCVPSYEYPGMVKVLVHDGVEVTPESRDTADVSAALTKVSVYVKEHLPLLESTPAIVEKCFYTMTPDGNPIMDEISPNIVVGTGYSGSGFKHSPASGLILASIALGTTSRLTAGYQLERYKFARVSNPASKL